MAESWYLDEIKSLKSQLRETEAKLNESEELASGRLKELKARDFELEDLDKKLLASEAACAEMRELLSFCDHIDGLMFKPGEDFHEADTEWWCNWQRGCKGALSSSAGKSILEEVEGLKNDLGDSEGAFEDVCEERDRWKSRAEVAERLARETQERLDEITRNRDELFELSQGHANAESLWRQANQAMLERAESAERSARVWQERALHELERAEKAERAFVDLKRTIDEEVCHESGCLCHFCEGMRHDDFGSDYIHKSELEKAVEREREECFTLLCEHGYWLAAQRIGARGKHD